VCEQDFVLSGSESPTTVDLVEVVTKLFKILRGKDGFADVIAQALWIRSIEIDTPVSFS
jgi:hypothetical protein